MRNNKAVRLFLLVLCLILCHALSGYAQENSTSVNYIFLGESRAEIDPDSLPWTDRTVNSSSDDLKITLKDVHFTDGLMSFTLERQTSVSASGIGGSSASLYLNGQTSAAGGGVGIEPGPDIRTETFAWYNTPSVLGMDWESFRVTFEDIFFTFSDGGKTVYIAPAEAYNWSFIFHNPETSSLNADGLAETVDEREIHTFGNSFDITFTGGIVSKGPDGEDDRFNFSLIAMSDLPSSYARQEGIWFNGIHQSGGDGEPVLAGDGKLIRSDHFEYQVPQTFSAAENSLTVWAGKVNFEISCTGQSVDPDMGYAWSWTDDLTDREGKSLFPVKLVQFSHISDRLPQPTDPVLFSQTMGNVTMDIVSLDLVSISRSRLYGNPNEMGENHYLQADLCFTIPDDGDWNIVPGPASVGSTEIWAGMMAAGVMIPADGEEQGRKCLQLRYDITNLAPDWNQPVTLNFDAIAAIPREGSPCSDIMHRYETNAAARELGITLSCTDNAASDIIRGPRDYVLRIESFDETKWTRADAEKELERLLDMHISGPWKFVIENIGDYITL